VIESLVRIRCVIDKLKPLDKKLKYQIDKLVKMATTPPTENIDQENKRDAEALSFKPNLNNIQIPDSATKTDSNKYAIPKMTPTPYEDNIGKKKKRTEQEKVKKSISWYLSENFGESPLELEASGTGRSVHELTSTFPADPSSAKTKYEEENFVRLQETKEEKKKRIKALANRNALQNEFKDLEQLSNLGLSATDEKNEQNPVMKKKSLHQIIHSLESGEGKRKRKMLSGDQDVPYPEENSSRKKIKGSVDKFGDEEIESDEGELKEDPYYEEIKEAKRQNTETRKALYSKSEAEQFVPLPDEEVGDGEKRAISYQIKKNKGLKPYRSKERRNPRIKHKNRFAQALKKLPAPIKKMNNPNFTKKPYQGETEGIRSDITRSVSLRQ